MRGWETSVSEPPTFILKASLVVRGGMRDRHHIAEEPCAVKVASTVLETGGAGDGLAEFNRPNDGTPELMNRHPTCYCTQVH